MTAYWVEQDLIRADEFRDGNVPAWMDLQRVAKEAVSAIPPTVRLVPSEADPPLAERIRSDSAAYVHEFLDLNKWLTHDIFFMRKPTFMLTHPEASRELLLAMVRLIPRAHIGIKIAVLLLILEGQRPGWITDVLGLKRQSLNLWMHRVNDRGL